MGFYYDDQLKNKDNTIRLYGNGPNYRGDPIATAIFNEDFEFEIGNSWSDFTGGNFAEGLFNQVKGFAPYAKFFADRINEIDFDKYKNKGGWVGAINKLGNMAKDQVVNGNINGAIDFLNSALVVQGTRFMYFAGTSIGMSNMGLKYTLMYDPVEGKTIKDQLEPLMEYVIGDYKTLSDVAATSKNSDIKSAAGEVGEFIGWQEAPGGFTMDLKNVQNNLKGTLKLEFGNMFKITNLVIRGCNVSMSRVKVKRSREGEDGKSTSLYAEVSLAFQPAGMITKNNLLSYLDPID